MIKLNKHNVTNGTVKARVHYSFGSLVDGRTCVTIYAKDYDRSLGEVFKDTYINETESREDYFDKGRVRIFENNPLYKAALARAEEAAKRWAK